ncbi:hypothetical protein M407DRAFT_10553 [Tulasnella calospora MUT 4182]|uniref:C2H2-type domain-containing protein n=1 Tax=Tulasnella calospora MUT 4182 TaxID=1051891 RepID=A0A0C3PZS4_9AGAM|nr:hypothetical protein M407DRAFT_10553 [Tulasnella calospora MUT 4182]
MLTSRALCFIPDYSSSPVGDTKQATSSTPYHAQPFLGPPELGPASHPTESNETPRTVYITSPGTELGDGDFADQSDDELDNPTGTKPVTHGASPSTLPVLRCDSAAPYTLGDLGVGDGLAVDETDLKSFTLRLHEDIRSAALFPWIPSAALSTLAPLSSDANTIPGPDFGCRLPSQSSAHDDVNHGVGPQRTQSTRQLSRKASMHLKTPSHPINPFQRPSFGRSTPPYPYPATMIDRTHLRRYQATRPPEQTISMKDLIVPNAEFHCGSHPETLVLELSSPPSDGLDYPDDLEEPGIELFPMAPEPNPLPVREPPSPEQRGTPEAPTTTEPDLGDSLTTSGEGACPLLTSFDDPPSPKQATPRDPPPRRSTRTSDHRASPIPSSSNRKGPQYSVSKPRARHLQPNLVRTNGCQYGCQLFFSTAYEARRHQEDAHGREEAYKLMKQLQTEDSSTPVFPHEYRFLIQIGLHASGDKWDASTKATFQRALTQQDVQLDQNATSALLQFAREWTKRYECPRCGTSFSRLDSKKRHYEKQCR